MKSIGSFWLEQAQRGKEGEEEKEEKRVVGKANVRLGGFARGHDPRVCLVLPTAPGGSSKAAHSKAAKR